MPEEFLRENLAFLNSLKSLQVQFSYDHKVSNFTIFMNYKPKLLDFVSEAKNLTELTVFSSLEERGQHFYDNLVSIRQSQAADSVLYLKAWGISSILKTPDGEKYVTLV